MIIITIKGEVIEVAEKEKITFSFESICNGIDKKKLSRTQSFKIPKTTKNLQIFGFSNRPEIFGAEMRVSFDAILTHGAGQIKGILYINEVSNDNFNATFLFGECLPLKRLKEAGKLSETINVSQSLILRPSVISNTSVVLGLWAHFNGQRDTNSAWKYPAVKISYLLNEAIATLDVACSSAFSNNYVFVLRSQNGATNNISTSSATYNYWSGWNNQFNSTYFIYDNVVVNDYGTSTTYKVLRCIQACRFKVYGTNVNNGNVGETAGLFVMRDVDYSNENDVNEFFSKKIYYSAYNLIYLNVELEPGDCLFYGIFKDVGSWGVEIIPNLSGQTLTGSIVGNGTKLALTQDSNGYLMGTFNLQDNLPDLSVFDLINLIAEMKGGVAFFNESIKKFDIFYWNFDAQGGSVVDVDKLLIKLNSIERKAFDFGQNHKHTLKEEDGVFYNQKAQDLMAKNYSISNTLLNKETKVEIKATATNTYISTFRGNKILAAIRNAIEYNENYNAGQLREGDNSIIANVESFSTYGVLTPAEVIKNVYMQKICDLSTKIKVEVMCDDIMWKKISSSFTRYTFRGGWYFCLNATYAKPKATLILQRYK